MDLSCISLVVFVYTIILLVVSRGFIVVIYSVYLKNVIT